MASQIMRPFKCLIELNAYKYMIPIHNNENPIQFIDVFNEIKQINGFESISHKTHYFEIYDRDFDVYVVITSDSLIIENLSRIRISSKLGSIDNQRVGINCKCWPHFDSEPNTEIYLNKTFQLLNESQELNLDSNETKMDSNDNISNNIVVKKEENHCKSDEKEGIPQISAGNAIKTVFNEEFECLSSLIQIISANVEYFKSNISNNDCEQKWILLSEIMVKNGFKKLSPKVCREYFTSLTTAYVPLIRNSRDYKTACDSYPLFELIHESYLNFSPFVNKKTHEKVLQLREKFNKKLTKNSNIVTNSVYNSSKLLQTILRVKPIMSRESIDLIESQILSNQYNVRLMNALIKHKNSIIYLNISLNTIWFKVSKTINKYHIYEDPYDCELKFKHLVSQLVSIMDLSVLYRELIIKSQMFNNLMKIPLKRLISERNYEKLLEFDESIDKPKTDFEFKFSELKPEKLNYYSVLLQIIDEEFVSNPKSSLGLSVKALEVIWDQKWNSVSDKMKSKGYQNCQLNQCRGSFFNFVMVYKQLLRYAPNREIANRVFPFFETMHGLDYRKYLSRDHRNVKQMKIAFEERNYLSNTKH